MNKPFSELTQDEAEALVRNIVNSSKSEKQIMERLAEAGFDTESTAVTSYSHGQMFMASVMVWGPRGAIQV